MKTYVIYDSRYLTDEDSASVYQMADTLNEARELVKTDWNDGVIVEYDIENETELTNPKIIL